VPLKVHLEFKNWPNHAVWGLKSPAEPQKANNFDSIIILAKAADFFCISYGTNNSVNA
jgi:hypothetical protein